MEVGTAGGLSGPCGRGGRSDRGEERDRDRTRRRNGPSDCDFGVDMVALWLRRVESLPALFGLWLLSVAVQRALPA